LSHSSSHFCPGYFGDRFLLFAHVGLDPDPPTLLFPPSLGWQAHTTTPSFFLLRWDFTNLFYCPTYPGTTVLLMSTSSVTWFNRHTPLCPAIKLLSCLPRPALNHNLSNLSLPGN
jgi:hypothetical protein